MKVTEADKLPLLTTESSFQMLGLAEFASHMSVCPNSVRNWIKGGKLVEGEHYFHIGRIYRFPWSPEFLKKLMLSLAPETLPIRPKMHSHTANRAQLRYHA